METDSSPIIINNKFNNNHPKYKCIKVTNICLLIVFILLEMITAPAAGKTFNIAPVLITFLIARYIIRYIFKKKPDFNYKIPITILVYVTTFIVKVVVLSLLLSILLS